MAKKVGYRFHPTDQELINYFLMNKILGNEILVQDAINEINICRFDPWDLPCLSKIQSDDRVWYFFCLRDNKNPNSRRANRKTENGYWKLTGRDRKIKGAGRSHEVVGSKKTLVFYKGRVPNGERTAWVMHEYHLSVIIPNKSAYLICKLKNNASGSTSISSCGEGEPSHLPASDPENHAVIEAISEEFNQIEEAPVESVCDFGGLDYDLGLNWNELMEGISLSDLLCPNDVSFNHNPLESQFHSIPESQEVANTPEFAGLQEFVNSFLADQDDSGNTDAETVHPLVNHYSPIHGVGGISSNTM